MSLAADLLDQAKHLAARESGRPRQASLRRAVSAAYYSLFHLIVDDAASFLARSSRLRPVVARSFEHKVIRKAAAAIGDVARRPSSNHWMQPLLDVPISAELVEVCDTFVNLQEHRHRADYDGTMRFTRVQTNGLVSDAFWAHTRWRTERTSHNARVFVLASAQLLGSR
ncbi:MAG TPA: hypothetical protein VNO30_14830 [Kofleriaceae bacterium]|nr:hypothetical protein [Kofleriaceae bacterium]